MAADLQRFVAAQAGSYAGALAEVRAGRKRSHWMWYVFPQLRGLGRSATAEHYGITGLAEAEAYLAHPVLGPRLREITEALLAQPARDPRQVFGSPDDLKLRSSMTLFARADDDADSPFRRVIWEFFGGEEDSATLGMLVAAGP